MAAWGLVPDANGAFVKSLDSLALMLLAVERCFSGAFDGVGAMLVVRLELVEDMRWKVSKYCESRIEMNDRAEIEGGFKDGWEYQLM